MSGQLNWFFAKDSNHIISLPLHILASCRKQHYAHKNNMEICNSNIKFEPDLQLSLVSASSLLLTARTFFPIFHQRMLKNWKNVLADGNWYKITDWREARKCVSLADLIKIAVPNKMTMHSFSDGWKNVDYFPCTQAHFKNSECFGQAQGHWNQWEWARPSKNHHHPKFEKRSLLYSVWDMTASFTRTKTGHMKRLQHRRNTSVAFSGFSLMSSSSSILYLWPSSW